MFCRWRALQPPWPPQAPSTRPALKSASDDGLAIPFNSNSSLVEDAARALAAKPFVPPVSDLPGPLANLSYDAYVGIRAKPESLIWPQDPSGFVIEPLHRGFVFGIPMQINLVEGGLARRLNYDAANFNFGGVTMSTPPTNLDFSGFRILQRGAGGSLREFAIFQARVSSARTPPVKIWV